MSDIYGAGFSPWQTAMMREYLEEAQALHKRNYNPYTGQRLAPLPSSFRSADRVRLKKQSKDIDKILKSKATAIAEQERLIKENTTPTAPDSRLSALADAEKAHRALWAERERLAHTHNNLGALRQASRLSPKIAALEKEITNRRQTIADVPWTDSVRLQILSQAQAALPKFEEEHKTLERERGAIKATSQRLKYKPEYLAAREAAEAARKKWISTGDTADETAWRTKDAALKAASPPNVQDIVESGIGKYAPYETLAKAHAHMGAGTFPGRVKEYLSPYTEHVVEKLRKSSKENFENNILPTINAQFIRNGAFGGGQHSNAVNRLAREVQEDTEGRAHQAMDRAYQQAGQLFNSDQARQLQASRQYSDLGTASQQANASDAAAMQNIAAAREAKQQQERTLAHQDYMQQEMSPETRLNQLGVWYGRATGPTQGFHMATGEPGAVLNPAGNIAGIAANAFGQGFAHGGPVHSSPGQMPSMPQLMKLISQLQRSKQQPTRYNPARETADPIMEVLKHFNPKKYSFNEYYDEEE